jgi:hypothetical protein
MLRLAGILGVVALVVPSVAQETAAPEGSADPKLVAKALAQPFLQGKLVGVDIEKKTFTLQAVVDSKKTLNKEGQQRYAQIYARAAQFYRAKNKGELDRIMPELQAAAQAVYDVKETIHTFKLQGTPTFEVRIEKLPPREGDDGKIKAYTPAELTKLKGNPNLPGYISDAKELDVEVQVKAYLSNKDKGKTPAKPEPPKLVIKTAGSSEKPEMMAEDAHPVNVILILPKADSLMIPGVPVPGGANPFIIK